MLVPCAICQTPVQRKPNQIARQAHVFCSYACRERGLGHAPTTMTPCAICGSPVTRKPSDRKHRGKAYTDAYCSNACRSLGHRSQQEMTCAQCGTPVLKHLSALKRTEHSFCSRACYNAFPYRDVIPTWDVLPDATVLGYMAGMMDGDGSISINRAGNQKIDVRIAVTDRPVLVWMQGQFPGQSTLRPRSRTQPGHKPMYDWSIIGNQAVMLLEAVGPYLLIKRDHGQRAIAFQRALDRNTMPMERISEPERIAEPMFPSKDAQMAYVAGFFDAEGSVAVHHDNYWNLAVIFANSNIAVLRYIQHAFPGGLITREARRALHHAQVYRLAFYGNNGVYALIAMAPFLHIKLEHATLGTHIHERSVLQRRTEGQPLIERLAIINTRGTKY